MDGVERPLWWLVRAARPSEYPRVEREQDQRSGEALGIDSGNPETVGHADELDGEELAGSAHRLDPQVGAQGFCLCLLHQELDCGGGVEVDRTQRAPRTQSSASVPALALPVV